MMFNCMGFLIECVLKPMTHRDIIIAIKARMRQRSVLSSRKQRFSGRIYHRCSRPTHLAFQSSMVVRHKKSDDPYAEYTSVGPSRSVD
jgi:hypothetical protein